MLATARSSPAVATTRAIAMAEASVARPGDAAMLAEVSASASTVRPSTVGGR